MKQVSKMKAFFFYCWLHLPRYSEVSNTWLGSEPNTLFYHHVYEKNDKANPELKYSISNILVVTGDEHFNLNKDLEFYPEAKKKREWVMDNYEYCVQESLRWEKNYEKFKTDL